MAIISHFWQLLNIITHRMHVRHYSALCHHTDAFFSSSISVNSSLKRQRQCEAGLVGCLMFSPASVSLINSWLSSVTNVSLPSSSPEEEEEEFLMFSLFYGSMFAAGIAARARACVCVWYTLFFSAPFLLRFIRDRESKRLTAFVLLARETKQEKKKKRRKEKQSKTIRHRSVYLGRRGLLKKRHLISGLRFWNTGLYGTEVH